MQQAGHQRDGPGADRRAGGRAIRAGWLLAVALLGGCKPEKNDAAANADGDGARVVVAAERDIVAALPAVKAMQFRGVRAYAQAAPGRWAICGQVSPFADDPNIYVPFVSVGAAGKAGYRFDREVGTTTAAADRVYIALVTYCYDKGGPVPGPFQSVTPMPPLPDMIADPSRRDSPAAVAATSGATSRSGLVIGAPVGQSGASGTVTMRQNANLHATPHGPPVRVVQQGTAMRVFAMAPGGWYQVGDLGAQASPWGWVHESMVDRR